MKVLNNFFKRDANVEVFALINTTAYNEGEYGIQIVEVEVSEMEKSDFQLFGWCGNENYPLLNNIGVRTDIQISNMVVNDIISSEDFEGAYLMRLK